MCTPGFLMAAKALLEKNPDPSEEEIRFGLAGNLCRCTGYDKIVRAVSNDCAPLKLARGRGLLALDVFPPARHFVAKRMIWGARAWP